MPLRPRVWYNRHVAGTRFWNEYHLPTSLDDALALLARYDGRARVIAGGTDLLLDLQSDYLDGQRPHYDALIDVTRIRGADMIREEDGLIVIGCAVTHAQIVGSPLLKARATALAEACAVIGGPQVRNVATLVGNVAHALPAADGAIALMVLDAEAQVKSQKLKAKSEKWVSLVSLCRGPGESAVDATRELIAAIRFRPTGAGEGSAFTRVMRPQGIALPILGVACKLKVKSQKLKVTDPQCVIENVAISAGPVAPTPFRARKTEEFLCGQVLDDETLARAAQVLLSEAQPRTSAHRATREYRIELLPTMLRQVLTRAVANASRQTNE